MAIKRVSKKGCWIRPAAADFMKRHRHVRFNILVPVAIETLTGRPFVDTWMRMKCGPLRFSRYWRTR